MSLCYSTTHRRFTINYTTPTNFYIYSLLINLPSLSSSLSSLLHFSHHHQHISLFLHQPHHLLHHHFLSIHHNLHSIFFLYSRHHHQRCSPSLSSPSLCFCSVLTLLSHLVTSFPLIHTFFLHYWVRLRGNPKLGIVNILPFSD